MLKLSADIILKFKLIYYIIIIIVIMPLYEIIVLLFFKLLWNNLENILD